MVFTVAIDHLFVIGDIKATSFILFFISRYFHLLAAESCMDVNVVRNTAKALTTLLLHRQTSKTPAYSAIRRAAIDLIGRGFALWEPHIDVSQVLIGLFELCADIETRLRSERGRNFSISAAKDLHRSAKHSLSLIATARPSACITTLAKEVCFLYINVRTKIPQDSSIRLLLFYVAV